MAVLKYKDENGNYQEIVGINVQNEVVQTTGQSTTAVMSQKAVSDLIPAQASASNQLADKDFVNSSVSTATATYQGSYNLVSDLSLTTQASHGQIEDALGNEISGADNNDYAFVQIPTSDSTPTEIASVERYKFNGTRWSFEYTLNNSGFTAEQWAAVNSGITSGLVAKINALSNNPQSSIASLFGMDSSGNFQNISAANLASVLGVWNAMLNPAIYIELAVGESKTITITAQRIFLYSDNYAHAGLIDLSWGKARVIDDGNVINKSGGISITSNIDTSKTFTNNTGNAAEVMLY